MNKILKDRWKDVKNPMIDPLAAIPYRWEVEANDGRIVQCKELRIVDRWIKLKGWVSKEGRKGA